MIRRLSQLARVTGGRLEGADATFSGVSTDTRTLAAGELFVCLRGPNFDGHEFIDAAVEKGATGALVEQVTQALPCVVVPDALRALADFAAAWREAFHIPVVAVTGSNGKTTVKELLASILRTRGPVLATRGNLNNQIGLPLTLLGLDAQHAAAVVEMGTNGPGEIALLARIAHPDVAIVTNASRAHLEGLGTVEAVAEEKGALFSALANGGVAVVNADDPHAPLWRQLAGTRRRLEFGLEAAADVTVRPGSLEMDADGSRFVLLAPQGHLPVHLPLPGRHNVMNALAAAAAAFAVGFSVEDVAAGLEQARAVPGRLQTRALAGGSVVVDDTYNANPASLHAAVDWATTVHEPVWLVLGDMKELGPGGREYHAEAGRHARAAGVARLFAVGELAAVAAHEFGDGAHAYADVTALIEDLQASMEAGVMILVKGSRSMRMERVVAALTDPVAPRAANGGS